MVEGSTVIISGIARWAQSHSAGSVASYPHEYMENLERS